METILKAILEYEKKTPIEIQEELKQIISTYGTEELCNIATEIGTSYICLKQICKKSYIEKGIKPLFTTYIKIKNIGENPNGKTIVKRGRPRKNIDKTCNELLSEEEMNRRKEEKRRKNQEYQREYYRRVLKKRRREQKLAQ